MKVEILDRATQEEYTGEKRCWACTIVNAIIAIIGGGIVLRRSRVGGLALTAMSFLLIYMRGYLIPGTPTLTKEYLPTYVLEWFGKRSDKSTVKSGLGHSGKESTIGHQSSGQHQREDETSEEFDREASSYKDAPVNLETYFLKMDVIERFEGGKDLRLTDEFENIWINTMSSASGNMEFPKEKILSLFGLHYSEKNYQLDSHEDAWVLYEECPDTDVVVGQWPSQTALIADVSAASILSRRDSNWKNRSPDSRGEILNSLRLFMEKCPNEGGTVEFKERTVESCCQSQNVIAAICSDSEDRLFEHPVTEL